MHPHIYPNTHMLQQRNASTALFKAGQRVCAE